MRQVKPKLVTEEVTIDEMDVVNNSFRKVGRRGDESELIPGLLGAGKWRRLKGGGSVISGGGSTVDGSVTSGGGPAACDSARVIAWP